MQSAAKHLYHSSNYLLVVVKMLRCALHDGLFCPLLPAQNPFNSRQFLRAKRQILQTAQ